MDMGVCVRVLESANIHRWTQGSHTSAAFLWLSPFWLLKISRDAVAEVSADCHCEHFPWVKTACTTIGPACCAAHACAAGPPLSRNLSHWGHVQSNCLMRFPKTWHLWASLIHMSTTVTQEISHDASIPKQDCLQAEQPHLSPISKL